MNNIHHMIPKLIDWNNHLMMGGFEWVNASNILVYTHIQDIYPTSQPYKCIMDQQPHDHFQLGSQTVSRRSNSRRKAISCIPAIDNRLSVWRWNNNMMWSWFVIIIVRGCFNVTKSQSFSFEQMLISYRSFHRLIHCQTTIPYHTTFQCPTWKTPQSIIIIEWFFPTSSQVAQATRAQHVRRCCR